jgi:hypothetical protein
MSRRYLWGRSTLSRLCRRAGAAGCALAACLIPSAPCFAVGGPGSDDIRLQLTPRVCTLSAGEKQCEATVSAQWQAGHNESLCLVIVERPEIKRCWENYSGGLYRIELTFADDLIFQLKDLQLQNVLASEVLRVIREVLEYRHRRPQPWNIFH